MNVWGIWKKISNSACSSRYPDTIAYDQNGIYKAEALPDSKMHPVWDVGTFKLKEGKIDMSTSNDAVISYAFKLKDDVLSFTDPDGCQVDYKQVYAPENLGI